jgi:glycosyltransferase involved in cell wall biosynthesis
MEIGGAQRVLLYQALWFHQHGYPMTVAFLYDKQNLHQEWQDKYPFQIVNLDANPIQSSLIGKGLTLMRGIWHLFILMRHQKFGGIETFTHHSNLIGIPLAWINRIPRRIASHHGQIHGFPKYLERIHAWMVNMGMANQLVVVSHPLRQIAIDEGVHPGRIVVVPNGVSLPEKAKIDQDRIRQDLQIPEGAHFVFTAGRMTYEKGHILFIKTIPLVLKRFPLTIFALAGDGILRPQLEDETHTLGIDAHVKFLGQRGDVPSLMAVADLFVLPSRSEGLPMALLEAMGMGNAIVATDVGGVSEVVHTGETGILVPPADASALANGIIQLLEDKNLREKIGRQAEEIISQHYSLEKMCQQYAYLLDPIYQKEIE